MMLSGLVFTLQLILLAVILCLCVMAWKTSRRHRSQQRSYLALAVVLGGMAVLGALATVVHAISVDEVEFWLDLWLPALSIALCGATMWRTTRVKQRQRRADAPSGGLRSR
ncbi:hypothetical protein [Ideonella sp. A 288]|uniref:hypothetical protein n=1 Tax=Ideonella sp. A 288 TaxID=1962181 RepID=UPI000B4B2E5A|nr:hypothetical protein [Ideonella sp. A 288]